VKLTLGAEDLCAARIEVDASNRRFEAATIEEEGINMEPLHVTDESFEKDVLKANVPVLVDFWAPWCGPCRMVAPILEELAVEYEGRALIAKMNTDDEAETPGQFRIMAIPTMILFKDGEEVERMVGLRQKNAIAESLDKLLQE
jgi:thioredoxin 1